MSKRSERRAAERANHKASKAQKLNPVPSSSSQALPIHAELATAASAHPSPYSSNLELDASVLLAPELEGFEAGVADCEIQAFKDRIERVSVSEVKPNPPTREHRFPIVNWESSIEMEALVQSFESEYVPETDTEQRLVGMMARHYWLMQRALTLQERIIPNDLSSAEIDSKRLALFMRYHATHERSYYRAAHELQNLRKQKAKEQIGFESQKSKTASGERDELRKQELHDSRVRLNNVRTEGKELDTSIRQVFEAPGLGLVVPKFLKNAPTRHPSAAISRTGV